jgi:hypothetical protein
MERGGGCSFGPKPMLHPSFVGDVNSYDVIHLKPYEFCKRGYAFYDVVVTSCKHTYHPFCLSEMLKSENKIWFARICFTLNGGPILDFVNKMKNCKCIPQQCIQG